MADRLTRKRRRALARSAAAGVVVDVGDPWEGGEPPPIDPQMQALAQQLAAADLAEVNAAWAALDADAQARFADHDDTDPDDTDTEPDDADSERGRESVLVRALAAGDGDPVDWVSVAAAVPGSLGRPMLAADAARVLPDPGDAVAQLQVIDRLAAWVASRRFVVVAAACPEPVDPDGGVGFRREQHLVEEVAVATRSGEGTARSLVETARLLDGPDAPFAAYAHALASGQVSEAHVRVLVRGTLRVTGNPQTPREQMLARIAQLTLPAAVRGTPAQLDRAVLAAVCQVDPDGEADRRAAARAARDVYVWTDRGSEPGTSTLASRDQAARVQAMHAHLTREAKRLQKARGGTAAARRGEPSARLGVCRTDVLAAMVLGLDPTTSTTTTTSSSASSTTTTGSRGGSTGTGTGTGTTGSGSGTTGSGSGTTGSGSGTTGSGGGTTGSGGGTTGSGGGTTGSGGGTTGSGGGTTGSGGGTTGSGSEASATAAGGPEPTGTASTDASTTPAGVAGAVPVDAVAVVAQGRLLEPVRAVFECRLVMDLPTLRNERDGVCLLDGSPIPAPVARELAASVTAWRRMVTDPVTGHLLDYGRRTYLPAPLVAFVKARDGECAAPYCQRPASRCQMDHRLSYPDGPSSAGNCGLYCDRHHPLKTDGFLTVTASRADGSATHTTAWAQTITTDPRPVLPDPTRAPPPPGYDPGDADDAGDTDDEPPF